MFEGYDMTDGQNFGRKRMRACGGRAKGKRRKEQERDETGGIMLTF